MGKLWSNRNHLTYYYATLIYLAPSMCLLMANLFLCWVISLYQMDIFTLFFILSCCSFFQNYFYSLWISKMCCHILHESIPFGMQTLPGEHIRILFSNPLLNARTAWMNLSQHCCRSVTSEQDRPFYLAAWSPQRLPVTPRIKCQACRYKKRKEGH